MTKAVYLEAYHRGWQNASQQRLAYEAGRFDLSPLYRAYMAAGFEDQRIGRGIGKYPVLLHDVGNRGAVFWLVGQHLFQATKSPDSPPNMNGAGYPDLEALMELKGSNNRLREESVS